EKAETNGLEILYDVQKLKEFTQKLPFELTNAQKRVTNEICRDLRSPQHMQRLLQGDVGSGKTVVAAIALYATVTAGFQGALMVPTEILAQQHMESLQQLFDPNEVTIALLTGSTKAKERRELLENLDFTDDVMNETADITLGDAWLPEYTMDSEGNNIVIIRNPIIKRIVEKALTEGRIKLDEI
ncbi:DEAD/DEAH box helicase, partial [Klebsiella pneumoniae]|nr:DEAD/DEAH box helicase [Klebsiella pneumoniae]